jgi:pyridoxine 5-phosphate synthase
MTRLSVNINKIATLRNSRGGNVPNVLQAAIDCQKFGAEGITVHPRPDERHIKYRDVWDIKPVITTEFNIEGYPSEKFIELVTQIKPHQVTLVPDPPGAITSNQGWDTLKNIAFLQQVNKTFQNAGIRVSIFVDPDPKMVEGAALTGANRIELYTEPYATNYPNNREEAVADYVAAAGMAKKLGLGLNAGHDLNLDNLKYLIQRIPYIDEVSIGHALIADALYYGLENTIQMYMRLLKQE